MTGTGFWHKSAALALILLMLLLASATSAPTAAAPNSHYAYGPDSVSVSVTPGDPAGDSFDLTVGLPFTPDPGWWVDTQMIVIPSADPFTFVFEPSSFTLNQATRSQVVHVTVTAAEGVLDGSRKIKAQMQPTSSGSPGIGRGAGSTVSITVIQTPTPTPDPPHEEPACFIATAAYGTSTSAELDTLRAFRDEVLLQNSLGSQFVALYYEFSPPLADFISEHDELRVLVRELLVDPLVWLVEALEAVWQH